MDSIPAQQPIEEPPRDEEALAPNAYEPDAYDGPAIPRLPPSPTFDTYDELYNFLQTFHRENSAAIVKMNSSNKRKVDGQPVLSNVIFICDRGPRRASKSAGLRKTSSVKLDCPVTIHASATKMLKNAADQGKFADIFQRL
ncbi:hypothetical protein G6O67_008257 [Ophiocordyceps sinensis]|uniref:Uncharacterized protein n=2 Tax=Ophiocordyceps sinensis TaxID=72228 RepID=A0A8H4LT44_9HYPO|nr:hypothetical protein OCS_03200 [Ophiocordyceps sinensis CO18]KAF4504860.1 hypothetical protein G6O67_008257 [Ophiocordyceps sinensis]